MAYISESPATYPVGITQIETNEPAVGGQGGVANRGLQELANRTAYLKAKTDAHDTALSDGPLLDKIKSIDGAGSGVDADLVRGLAADFTRSLNVTGYQKLPGGLILQWGRASGDPSGIVTVTLPITFPNALFVALATDIALGSAADNTDLVSWREDTSTTSQLVFITANDQTTLAPTAFAWLALGK